MKYTKTTYLVFLISILITSLSCSGDDDNGELPISNHTYEFQLISSQQTIELAGTMPRNAGSSDVLAIHVGSENHDFDYDVIVMHIIDGNIAINAGLLLNNNQQPLALSFEGYGEGINSLLSLTPGNSTSVPLVATSGSVTLSNLEFFGDPSVPESHVSFTMNFEGEFLDVQNEVTYQGTGKVVIQPFSF